MARAAAWQFGRRDEYWPRRVAAVAAQREFWVDGWETKSGAFGFGPVTGARDAALKKGITINGLPIMLKGTSPSIMDIDDLDLYYEDCVLEGQTRLWWQSGTATS